MIGDGEEEKKKIVEKEDRGSVINSIVEVIDGKFNGIEMIGF